VFVVVSLAGCGEPDVRVYTAPKPLKVDTGGEPQYQILGAVFPANDPKYFFKLAGKTEDVAAQAAVFDKLVDSVEFPNGLDKNPTWTRPEGTRDGGPREMRIGTVIVGSLEIAISEASGGLAANMGRWAGQVGTSDQSVTTTEVKTKSGVLGLRVTVSGPKNPVASRPMMMGK
jgi:hypothetical protein